MTIFLQNKYTKWYESITSKAKLRFSLNGYTENHHIMPISLGGKNTVDNVCKLTAKEHFICHLLLTKMTSGKAKAKCIYALSMMLKITPKLLRYTTKNSRTIATLREKMAKVSSETHKGKSVSDQQRKLQSIAMTGRILSNNHRLKISLGQKGKIVSVQCRDKISKANKGKTRSAEQRLTISKHHADVNGSKNPRAKKITIKSPEGVVYEAHGNFADLCQELGLAFSTMCNLLRGHKPTRGKCVGWEASEEVAA